MGGNALFNPVLTEGGTLYIDDGRPMPGQIDETLRPLGLLHRPVPAIVPQFDRHVGDRVLAADPLHLTLGRLERGQLG